MANVKKEKGLTALIIAIILAIASIAYVIAAGLTTAVFDNQEFEEAVAMAFEKNVGTLSKKALSEVDYVEVASDGTNLSAYFGYEDFLARRDEYVAEQEKIAEITEANEKAKEEAEKNGTTAEEQPVPEATVKHPIELAKAGIAGISGTEVKLPDIKYFSGAEILSLTGVVVNSQDLVPLTNITEATFASCQLDTLDFFKGVDLSKVSEVNFVSCSIENEDYTVLEPIADKVNITQYGFEMGEDGNYTIVPTTQTLKEKLDAQAEAEKENAADGEEDKTDADGAEGTTEPEATEENEQESVTE